MLITKKPWSILKIMLVRAYIFPVPKKKTISMLPRWEDSTNICTLIIWRIWMEKTLKHLVHLKGIIRDHPLAEAEWWEDGVWQMLRSKLLINHTRNGLKWLPNIAVRCYQYFTQVSPYVKGRQISLISHLAHSLMVLLSIPDQPQALLHTELFQDSGNNGQFSLYI